MQICQEKLSYCRRHCEPVSHCELTNSMNGPISNWVTPKMAEVCCVFKQANTWLHVATLDIPVNLMCLGTNRYMAECAQLLNQKTLKSPPTPLQQSSLVWTDLVIHICDMQL
eukprot:GHVU01053691.1.p1 GENE.GHVU01053691.1~~GHVU01053691.1.p1  ORF type:complete len:112 (-),score=5.27 GHVU01053691.1:2372-2707(-)